MQRSEPPPGAAPSLSASLRLVPPEGTLEARPESSMDRPPRIERPEVEKTEIIVIKNKPGRPEPPSELPAWRAWASSLGRPYGEWRLPELQWRAYAVPALAVLVIAEATAIGVQYYRASAATPLSPAGARPFATESSQPAHTSPASQGVAAAAVGTGGSLKSATPSAAASTAPLTSPPPARSGWIDVRSAVDLDVWEGRRRLGEGSRDRIELAEGDHEIDLVNDELGYRERKRVRVTRGRVAAITPVLPTGVLHLNAAPWAEVSLDGQALGTTPLGNVRTPIGGHDITFRHPQLGSRNVRVTVTAGTAVRTSVDMREQ